LATHTAYSTYACKKAIKWTSAKNVAEKNCIIMGGPQNLCKYQVAEKERKKEMKISLSPHDSNYTILEFTCAHKKFLSFRTQIFTTSDLLLKNSHAYTLESL
jgi:hypothetical protein